MNYMCWLCLFVGFNLIIKNLLDVLSVPVLLINLWSSFSSTIMFISSNKKNLSGLLCISPVQFMNAVCQTAENLCLLWSPLIFTTFIGYSEGKRNKETKIPHFWNVNFNLMNQHEWFKRKKGPQLKGMNQCLHITDSLAKNQF